MTLKANIKNAVPYPIKKHLMRWGKAGVKKHAANTTWTLAARVINLTVGFLAGIFIIRQLGPAEYGYLSYAVSYTGLFSIICSLGTDTILYRELITHPERRGALLGTALRIKLFAGALATICTIIAATLTPKRDLSYYAIIIISFTYILQAFNVASFDFQAQLQQKYPAIINTTSTFVLNALKLLIIFAGGGVVSLAFVFLLDPALNGALYLLVHRQKHSIVIGKWSYDTGLAKKLIIDSWPFIFTAAFSVVYTRIDQVMLKQMLDSRATGLYDAAVRIAEAWLFIPVTVASSLFPAIISVRRTSPIEYKKRLIALLGLLLALSIGCAIPLALVAKPLMVFLYGNAFTASGGVLAIYTISGIWMSLSYAVQNFLIAENARTTIFLTTSSAALLNILINMALIPRYGIYGAAWATTISYAALTVPAFKIFALKNPPSCSTH